MLSNWLNTVHVEAKKQNLKPNIVLLLTYTGWIKPAKQNRYIESYIENIINLVDGKPYAPYISKEKIILVDIRQDSLEDIRGKLFDRIRRQQSWGAKRPIRWLYLEAELLRRTTYTEKSYLGRYEIEDYDDERDPTSTRFRSERGSFSIWYG